MSAERFSDALGWRSLSDADRQREYSPSSCVDGDLGPFIQEYTDASQAARAWCTEQGHEIQTVAYGSSPAQTVDVVVPHAPAAPLLVFIHGGYWQELSKRESFSAAPGFLANGIAYAAVDYTLAPSVSIAEIADECRAAVAHLVASADRLGIDPDRIVVAGSSAGGHLTAMVALNPNHPWRPAGICLLSGVFELEPLVGTDINDALGLDAVGAHHVSPARLPLVDPPPAVVAWGQNETSQFKRQSRLFAEALRAAGGTASELEVPDRNHFDILSTLGDADSPLGQAVLRLFDRR